MTQTIAILDDEPERIQAMRAWLSAHYASRPVVDFDNAPDMNDWFAANLTECRLICLDHDLGPNRRRDGEIFDPGIGRDVANFLASQSPVCPVIIHTTNHIARPGMISTLQDAGWKVSYVSPYADLLWVQEVWADAVRAALG